MLSSQLHLVAEPETLPFSLEDASRPETEVEDKGFNNVLLKTRLDHRILDLRVCSNGPNSELVNNARLHPRRRRIRLSSSFKQRLPTYFGNSLILKVS